MVSEPPVIVSVAPSEPALSVIPVSVSLNSEPLPNVPEPVTPVWRSRLKVVIAIEPRSVTDTVVAPPSSLNVPAGCAPVIPANAQSVVVDGLYRNETELVENETGPKTALTEKLLPAAYKTAAPTVGVNDAIVSEPPVIVSVAPSEPALSVIPVSVSLNSEPLPSVPEPVIPVWRSRLKVVIAIEPRSVTVTVVAPPSSLNVPAGCAPVIPANAQSVVVDGL